MIWNVGEHVTFPYEVVWQVPLDQPLLQSLPDEDELLPNILLSPVTRTALYQPETQTRQVRACLTPTCIGCV